MPVREEERRQQRATSFPLFITDERSPLALVNVPCFSASQSKGPWGKRVFVEKTWAPLELQSWRGYSMYILFSRTASRQQRDCTDCRANLPEMPPQPFRTKFFFASLRIPQASSSSAYALAFSDLLKYRYCKLSKVVIKERSMEAREATKEEIFLKCVQTPGKRDSPQQKTAIYYYTCVLPIFGAAPETKNPGS